MHSRLQLKLHLNTHAEKTNPKKQPTIETRKKELHAWDEIPRGWIQMERQPRETNQCNNEYATIIQKMQATGNTRRISSDQTQLQMPTNSASMLRTEKEYKVATTQYTETFKRTI